MGWKTAIRLVARCSTAGTVVLALGCSQLPPSAVDPPAPAGDKVPVILVPGVTGTMLRERATGDVAWGRGIDLVRPHDGGYSTARPISLGRSADPILEPFKVIESIQLGPVERPIYGPLVKLLERQGYRKGDLESPGPRDSLFLFAYDFRQCNTVSASQLLQQLESLRLARGDSDLEVDLICQSGGALVCRYLLKYGGATLEQAEAGAGGLQPSIRISKLIMVSPSNGGSLRSFGLLDRGRKYLKLIGRTFLPETMFTVVSLFQDLPAYRQDLFVDDSGRTMDVDLFDPDSWQRYGWSIFGAGAEKRLRRQRRADLFGTAEERRSYLEQVLVDARRLHLLLASDVGACGGTEYLLIQDVFQETPARVVLDQQDERWRSRLSGDTWFKDRPFLDALATAAGDGHATRESQLWLSPQEHSALAEVFQARGRHFDVINQPAVQEYLVRVLADGPPA